MKTINTADATGAALDWLVAKCKGHCLALAVFLPAWGRGEWAPSTDWSQGGPLLVQEIAKGMLLSGGVGWARACYLDVDDYGNTFDLHISVAPTPLVAVCRSFVIQKLGNTAEVPEELL